MNHDTLLRDLRSYLNSLLNSVTNHSTYNIIFLSNLLLNIIDVEIRKCMQLCTDT
jgi:hypothetical protein